MPSAADRLEFAPPQQPGMLRAFGLAIVAHMLLMLALTWGVNWKREADSLSAEAELWSAVPQQAAPKPVEAAPPPPPPPAPPKVAPAPPPPPPVAREADIALERERKKQAEAQREEELDRQKRLAEKKRQDELKKQELAKKAADDKKRAEAIKVATAEEAKKAEESRRQENLERIRRMAEGTGNPASAGTAPRASGPSASYAGRIAARIRANVYFPDSINGNPAAEVRIRVAPDGTIVGKTLTRSSGIKAWDEAVLRAIEKTAVLPRDTDGSVVPEFPISFRPND